ncbi:MAG TPA: MogA/MoaB family molybdenum cofactor biosynthesis protein [Planctomycetota bacterium]|nr:MogA/MoaB family molybdenum cofactor biosynthesis protein [Planctomycetota bacterium]
MGAKDHKDHADQEAFARCAILTVSDTRTRETDTSGKRAFEVFRKFGHTVVLHEIVPNDRKKLAEAIERALKEADVVLTVGGTGASRRDLSVETVRTYVDKELPGFGEMFRALSVKEIGTAAILSRALLGVTAAGKVLVALPGSEAAVRLALEDILVGELKHLLWELRRYA